MVYREPIHAVNLLDELEAHRTSDSAVPEYQPEYM